LDEKYEEVKYLWVFATSPCPKYSLRKGGTQENNIVDTVWKPILPVDAKKKKPIGQDDEDTALRADFATTKQP
jgi:hypothetical protein